MRRTAEFPSAWKVYQVIPIPKPGKPPAALSFCRSIFLTSCVKKLLERLVFYHLTWQLDPNSSLSDQLSGFRKHRSTTEAIKVTSFEEARWERRCAFLYVCKVFDALQHANILCQLIFFGITEKGDAYIRRILQGRTLVVSVQGVTSTPTKVTQGVPQRRVISPFFSF